MSHLLQMRGLKRLTKKMTGRILRSHLLQMRGLKHIEDRREQRPSWSHLLQMRGLKQINILSNSPYLCRIFYRCVD